MAQDLGQRGRRNRGGGRCRKDRGKSASRAAKKAAGSSRASSRIRAAATSTVVSTARARGKCIQERPVPTGWVKARLGAECLVAGDSEGISSILPYSPRFQCTHSSQIGQDGLDRKSRHRPQSRCGGQATTQRIAPEELAQEGCPSTVTILWRGVVRALGDRGRSPNAPAHEDDALRWLTPGVWWNPSPLPVV